MARLSRRARNRWWFIRDEVLISEGFSPEEAALIAYTRISSYSVRKLRRNRRRLVQIEIDKGALPREATKIVYERLKYTDQEVLDWAAFSRLIYR
jgi:hypothetical protein